MQPEWRRWLRATAAARARLAECVKRPTSQKARRRIAQIADVLRDNCGQLHSAMNDLSALDRRSLASLRHAACTSLSEVLTDSLQLLALVLPADFFAASAAAKASELAFWSDSELRGVCHMVDLFAISLQALRDFVHTSATNVAVEGQVVLSLLPFKPCRLLASAAALLEAHSATCVPPAKAFVALLISSFNCQGAAAPLMLDELRSAPMLQLTCSVAARIVNGELDDVPTAALSGRDGIYNPLIVMLSTISNSAASPSTDCVVWHWFVALPEFGQMLLQGLRSGVRLHTRLSPADGRGRLLFTKLLVVTKNWLNSQSDEARRSRPSGTDSAFPQTGPFGRSSCTSAAGPSSDDPVGALLVTAGHVSGTLQALESFGFLAVDAHNHISVEQALGIMRRDVAADQLQNWVLLDACNVVMMLWHRLDWQAQASAFVPSVSFAQHLLRYVLTAKTPLGTAAGRCATAMPSSSRAGHVAAAATQPSHTPPDRNTSTATFRAVPPHPVPATAILEGELLIDGATERDACSGRCHDGTSGRPVWAGQLPSPAVSENVPLVLPHMALLLMTSCMKPRPEDKGSWHGLRSRAKWLVRSGVLSTCEAVLRTTAMHGPCGFGDVELRMQSGVYALNLALGAALQLPVHQQRAQADHAPSTRPANIHGAQAQAVAEQAQATLQSLTATMRKSIVRVTHSTAGMHASMLMGVLRPLGLLLDHGLERHSVHQGDSILAAHRDTLRMFAAQLLLPTVRHARACVRVRYKCNHDEPCTHGCNEAAHESVLQALSVLMQVAAALHKHGFEDVTLAAGVPKLLRDVLSTSAGSSGSSQIPSHRLNNCLVGWQLLAAALRHTGWRDEVQRQGLMALVVTIVQQLCDSPLCPGELRLNNIVLTTSPLLLAIMPPLPPGQTGHSLAEVANAMSSAHALGYDFLAGGAPAEPSLCRASLRCDPSWDACLCIAAAAPSPLSSLKVAAAEGRERQPASSFVGCWYRGCGNVDSASEAVLPLRRCSGCRLARYCGEMCQRRAWIGGHRAVCAAWRQQME